MYRYLSKNLGNVDKDGEFPVKGWFDCVLRQTQPGTEVKIRLSAETEGRKMLRSTS